MSFLDKDNSFFAMANQGRRSTNVYLAVAVLVVLMTLVFGTVTPIGEHIFSRDGAAEDLYNSPVFFIVPFALLVIGIWGWVAGFERRPFGTIGFPSQGWLRKFVVGLLLGFGMMAATVFLMWVSGSIVVDTSGTQNSGISAIGGALIFLIAFLVQGGAEEAVIRGWLMQTVGFHHRPIVGIIVANLLFVICHGSINPMVVLGMLLFSLFLTLYCLKEGSIWGICGWHASWNWAQSNFFGLNLTGHGYTGGTIFDLKATGATLISGGGFGPEASIMCTVVLSAGIGWLWYSMRNNSRAVRDQSESVAGISD